VIGYHGSTTAACCLGCNSMADWLLRLELDHVYSQWVFLGYWPVAGPSPWCCCSWGRQWSGTAGGMRLDRLPLTTASSAN